ncbi:MAG: hypothetical protein N3F65_02445 [Nitrososphaeria archaeon]|nr:hypothetical protein [Aigarchaeota archaeon]MCX8187453.1 hypothetical protein [Nitrososphaeria archaeon]MDW8021087.1 hypothetical protein [Nitrososphaerota archaeon]
MEKKEKGQGIVIKPEYIETPRGKVPTFEFVYSLSKAISILDEVTANIEEKLERLEERGEVPQNIEEVRERLSAVENAIKELEKKIELDLGEILDRLSALTDAFNELVERVQKLEGSPPKD